MPLVRVEVRNEFALGRRELYGEGASREDPKAVLDGFAVAGLTGILRQLGDLAEFAAEVFHGLQEQISVTSYRSRKLMARTQRMEAVLPSLEKLVLSQTSHIHFAYTAGSEWHARIHNVQHHFIDNDLPRFIMDSYEECRDPPRLHLLDKFDPGGPGSCLRRYSDPTFFRRVLTSVDETNSLKVRGEKKIRKMKKKRSFPKNAVFAHGTSKFSHSSRLQFSSPIMSGLSSPTALMSDSTIKSNAGHGVNSSDMRSQSGYIDCIINRRNEMHPEEQESSRSSSSRLMLHEDTTYSVSADEQNDAVGGYSLRKAQQEGSTSNQSSVTWDEKAEIVEAEEYKHDLNEARMEIEVPTGSSPLSGEAVIGEKPDGKNISHHNSDNTKSIFCVNSLEDVDSEPDNYEDALNIIESESETDAECQTKLEVKQQLTDVDVKEIGVATDEPMITLSNLENDSGHCIPSVEVTCLQSSPPASSDIGAEEKMHQNLEGFANSDSPRANPVLQSVDTDKVENLESVVGCLSGSGSATCQDSTNSLIEHQDSVSKNVGVQLWTNGSLLGLQPSKPPDFATSNVSNSSSGMRCIHDGISDEQWDGKPAMHAKISDSIEKELCEPSIAAKVDQSSPSNDEISMVSLPGDLGAKLETTGRNETNYPNGDGLTSTSVVVPGNVVPVAPKANIAPNEPQLGTDENFSGILGLGQRLLANSLSFRKKISVANDAGSNPAGNSKSYIYDHGCRSPDSSGQINTMRMFKEQFQNVVAANLRPPSPPLEHMKISFIPMNGYGTSSLKLKFPHDTSCQDSSRDMFASFQLVPASTMPLQDGCFDSDDGTFCRSSPYESDNSPSHLSASDSDDWESNHSSENKEHDQHDSMQRLSSVSSVSTTQDQRGAAPDRLCINDRFGSMLTENSEDTLAPFSLRDLPLDLPSFESMNSPVQEHKVGADPNIPEMRGPHQSTPPPPPLPPMEWKNLKPYSNGADTVQVLANDFLNRTVVSDTSVSDMFQLPKEAPASPEHDSEEILEVTSKSKEQPKLSPYKAANLSANGLEMDEREDFLHQIRTKSFNLRRTVPPRPTSTLDATAANFKVTAILQKANAIRQAVGSEDGDDDGDDSWSDNV